MHRTITGVRYKHAIRKGNIRNALRLVQIANPMEHLARRQIDDAQKLAEGLKAALAQINIAKS